MKRQLLLHWCEPANHLMVLNGQLGRRLKTVKVGFVGIPDKSREFVEKKSRIVTFAYTSKNVWKKLASWVTFVRGQRTVHSVASCQLNLIVSISCRGFPSYLS